MRSLSMLIKPASGLCNMRCRYCFYADVAAHRTTSSYGIMTEETAEALVRRAFEYADGDVSFAFQGGEPTLAGADFYRTFIRFTERYNTKKLPVHYSIQTNGYAIPDELYAIMRENRFLVGVSLDGTAEWHDAARIDANGDGTFKKVTETVRRLQGSGIDYNVLTVLTEQNAKHIASIYRYFRSRGVPSVQFIRHIDGFGDTEEKTPFSLTPERYLSFLRTAFGLYYDDILAGHYHSVREFDNFVLLASGRPAECCGMNGACPANLVLEADGGVYPCDFYVLDEWRMGNIRTDSVDALLASDAAERFRARSRKVDPACRTCPWYRLCRGGCARYREPAEEDGLGRNRYCESYRAFFSEAAPKLKKLADMLNAGQIR